MHLAEKKIMKFDLEDRLVRFTSLILPIAESISGRPGIAHLSNQLARSCTSPALNYGEAQGAESRRDFIHKMKVALKELRETSINLKIIAAHGGAEDFNKLGFAIQENNELIAIFVKSIKTASNSKDN
jgi:four helix bundle protein